MRRALCLAALLAIALVACGDDDDDDDDDDGGGGGAARPQLVVSAASSMKEALTACGPEFTDARVRYQFAGSDELAAQIEQGVKPDVFASANTKLPDQLYEDGRLGEPVEFATNELVIAVPKDSKIAAVGDLTADGVKIAMGSETVPIGSYTRETLAKLPKAESEAILANVRSNEPDVKGIVGKLAQGAVDAGFVYVTDVNAVADQLTAVELPQAPEPDVTYAAGVVDGAEQPEQAQAFVDGLLDGPCGDALREAGFGAAP